MIERNVWASMLKGQPREEKQFTNDLIVARKVPGARHAIKSGFSVNDMENPEAAMHKEKVFSTGQKPFSAWSLIAKPPV